MLVIAAAVATDPQAVRDLLVAMVQVAPTLLIALAVAGRVLADDRPSLSDYVLLPFVTIAIVGSFVAAVLGVVGYHDPVRLLFLSLLGAMFAIGLIAMAGVLDIAPDERPGLFAGSVLVLSMTATAASVVIAVILFDRALF